MQLEPKDIPGFEDNYYLDPINMTVVNKKTGHALTPQKDGKGYAGVKLWKNNKGTNKTLHRLFAEAYIPNPDNLPVINHKDENPLNYNLDNLEWCTQSHNQKYGTANERRGPKISAAKKGKPKHPNSGRPCKETVAVNLETKEKTTYCSASEAARQLGIKKGQVANVLCGHRKTTAGYTFYYT